MAKSPAQSTNAHCYMATKFAAKGYAESDDPLIRVNRSNHPKTKGITILDPELSSCGPQEYRLSQLVMWNIPTAYIGNAPTGHEVYAYLERNNLLRRCISPIDLKQIEARSIRSFHIRFRAWVVVAWRNIIQEQSGKIVAPYIQSDGSNLNTGHLSLDEIFHSGTYMTLLFRV